MILGTDPDDVLTQRQIWLAEHPKINVIRSSTPKREPPTLLTRMGGKVPRVSIVVDYELPEAAENAGVMLAVAFATEAGQEPIGPGRSGPLCATGPSKSWAETRAVSLR